MDKHLNLLGILYIVLGVFHIFSISVAAIFLFGFNEFSGVVEIGFVRVIIAFVFGLIILVSLLGIVGGIGLLKGQGWARGLVLVLGFIILVNIPLGTLLGIYTIWALLLRENGAPQSKTL